MADLRPFAALRYRAEAIDDLSAVLAPPFDVIAPDEQRVLLTRSPHNVVRLELPAASGPGADRYQAAAETLRCAQHDG